MALVLTGELTIDCNNIACITFTDTTGAYSLSNTTGYGSPNPRIDQIASVDFIITDSDDTEWTFSDAPYTPNANGDSTICLEADNFTNGSDTLVYTAGESYTFLYVVNIADSEPYELEEAFDFPCCGNPITSNLTTAIAIQQNIGCASFVFSDVTGVYDSSTNPGGYGTPNPSYGDITSTTILIELANGDSVTISSFIPTEENHSITIQASDLGYTGAIPDQIINITYSVFVEGDCRIGYKNTSVLLYCQTQACIDAKIATVLETPCGCDGQPQVDNVMNMLFELDSIKIVAGRNMSCVNGKIESLLQKCRAGCSNC